MQHFKYRDGQRQGWLQRRALFLALSIFVLSLSFVHASPAAQVMLKWEPNTEAILAGYSVHYGEASRRYTSRVDLANRETACVIGSLEAGRTYYFAVTAYDVNGDHSDYSTEVHTTVASGPAEGETQSFFTLEDTPVAGHLGVAGAQGNKPTFSIVTPPSRGTVTLTAATGAFLYTPHANVHGGDSFTFSSLDGRSRSPVAKVSIQIAPVNDPPTAVDDQVTITRGVTPVLDVLANDSDIDGDALAIETVSPPAHGLADIVAGGIRYTPPAGFTGTDSFTYTVSDGKGGTASVQVAVRVLATNKAPLAADSSVSLRAGSSVSAEVRAWDPDGNPLTYSIVSPPSVGRLSSFNERTGAFTYTAPFGFTGMDGFTFRAEDGKVSSNTATVSLTVAAAKDVVLAVNAGGPETVDGSGLVFQADTFFSGGWKATRSSSAENTADDLIYQSERVGHFSYTIPLEDGHYLVTLKFAEIYWDENGRRVFDVHMEDRKVIANLDIHAVAGKFKAHDHCIPVWVRDGALNLDFRADANYPKLSGFVVEKWDGDSKWGINAGGPRFVGDSGIVYEEDMFYSSGARAGTSAEILDAGDGEPYRTERFGAFSYDIPLPDGVYQVTLKFAEIYWKEPGKRVFDVSIEGREVLGGLDLLAWVGPLEPYDFPILSVVEDGELNIVLTPRVNWAKVSAILVEGLP
jgi:hypothetical protein